MKHLISDTREKKNQHVLDYFEAVGIKYEIAKLDFGDYMDAYRPGIVIDRKQNSLPKDSRQPIGEWLQQTWYSRSDERYVCCTEAWCFGNGQVHDAISMEKEKCKTLNCMNDPMEVVIAIDRAAFNQGENAQFDISIGGGGIAHTIVARGPGAVCYKEPLERCATMTTSSRNNNKLTKESM